MTEQEIRRELEAILKEAQDRAELIGSILALLDAEKTQETAQGR